jgi:hypothetical protein
VNTVKNYIEEHDEEKKKLLELMNVKRLLIPYLSLSRGISEVFLIQK